MPPLSTLSWITVMADDAPGGQAVFLGAWAEIMDTERKSRAVLLVADNTAVIAPVRQNPHHDVAGLPLWHRITRGCCRQCDAVPLEEGHEVRDAPMVNVRVGAAQAPLLRVHIEGA